MNAEVLLGFFLDVIIERIVGDGFMCVVVATASLAVKRRKSNEPAP